MVSVYIVLTVLSAAEVSESSAMEDYASDAQMHDPLPRDVFASTPYRRSKWYSVLQTRYKKVLLFPLPVTSLYKAL